MLIVTGDAYVAIVDKSLLISCYSFWPVLSHFYNDPCIPLGIQRCNPCMGSLSVITSCHYYDQSKSQDSHGQLNSLGLTWRDDDCQDLECIIGHHQVILFITIAK